MQFSMYKTSIYNMSSVTISFFNLSVRLFFSFIESEKEKKRIWCPKEFSREFESFI